MKTRTGKQIRDRYVNRLNRDLKKSKFSLGEDLLVLKLHRKVCYNWTKIATDLPGRSADNVKIRYYNSIRNNINLLLFLERRDFGVKEVITILNT